MDSWMNGKWKDRWMTDVDGGWMLDGSMDG